jgi:parvulin-like peptidyl-prolyl isomerase
MYAGSARSSATRSKEEAQTQIDDLKAKLDAGGDFGQLASEFSDCPSSKRMGDLGMFGRGQMVGPFEDATYGMQVGETSGVVETQFGFHIIQRTA